MTKHCVLVVDLEATCTEDDEIASEHMETIEIGACFIDGEGNVIDRYQSFVRPIRNPQLSQFCSRLTGINQEDVDAAPTFAVAAQLLTKFIDHHKMQETEWLSWGNYDLKQIERDSVFHEISNPIKLPHKNAKRLFAKAQRIGKEVGMAKAIQLTGLSLEGTHHRALDDALNIARLLPWVYGEKTLKTSNP